MPHFTRKEYEYNICRIAEKYSNRVGPCLKDKSILEAAIAGVRCFLMQMAFEFGSPDNETIEETSVLAFRIMQLNDDGVRWGLIPVELGLVPGEAPSEPVHTSSSLLAQK